MAKHFGFKIGDKVYIERKGMPRIFGKITDIDYNHIAIIKDVHSNCTYTMMLSNPRGDKFSALHHYKI